MDHTQFLAAGKIFIRQRLYHLINNIMYIPKCKCCDNIVRWNDSAPALSQQYRTYCSKKCQQNDPDNRDKKAATEVERYGKDRSSIINKMQQTNLERYGVEYAIQSETVNDKRVNTNQRKYGVDNVMQCNAVLEKRIQTNKKLYGGNAPACSKQVQQKALSAYVLKYGSVSERYAQSSHKMITAHSNNHLNNHYMRRHISQQSLQRLADPSWLITQNVTNKLNINEIASILDVHPSTVSRAFTIHKIKTTQYPKSQLEQEVINFLSLYIPITDIMVNSRTVISPHELDIFIPHKNIAIEINGIYWHSELMGRDRYYHLNKHNMCKDRGIQLLQIYDNEWNTSNELVKSRILSKLGLNQSLYARKCNVVTITNAVAKQFLQINHIQRHAHSSVNIGLIHNNILVAVLTLGKSRFDTKIEWELIRYASMMNINVVGGASKLLSYFIKEYVPSTIISYSDNRWNTGNMYKALGFGYSHSSKPNYFYFHQNKTNILHSRIIFQKHKLPTLLDTFDSGMTEWENMINNGYNRIWDCGNSVWIWNKNSNCDKVHIL
jgi:hypothetical protein